MTCKNILKIRMKKLKENTSVDYAILEVIREFMSVIIWKVINRKLKRLVY